MTVAPSERPTLALDVDGVLLDPDRSGRGHWTNELTARHGIERAQLRDAFFAPMWDDVITGRRPIEPALAEALAAIGTDVDVETVLECWFEADFVPIDATFELAGRAAASGCRVVLATNQEHRRAADLEQRIGADIPLAAVCSSASIGHPKHDPRFFDVASTRLGIAPADRSSVVFVDDVAANVDVARSAGWRGVHADADGSWRDVVADLLEL